MTQDSATPVAAAAGIDDEDFGARIARLGLPSTPNVIGKNGEAANCPHVGVYCFCNVYTTMLERPDMANIPDSPERVESSATTTTITTTITTTNMWRDERRAPTATPRGNTRATIGSGTSGSLTNGAPKSALGKKISLGQYASQKKDKANGLAHRESKSPTRGDKRWVMFCGLIFRIELMGFADQSSASLQMQCPKGNRTGKKMYVILGRIGPRIHSNAKEVRHPHLHQQKNHLHPLL